MQPAGPSLKGAAEAAQATAEGAAAPAHRQTQIGLPSSKAVQKRKRGNGAQPVDSLPATSSQQQKQPLVSKGTQQPRRQSQQLSQQLPQQAQQAQQLPQQAQQAQQLPQQLTQRLPQQQQQASRQLPGNDGQAEQKKESRPKRKLEGAFGEVRDGEATPGFQAGVMAEKDERGKRQRLRMQEQASATDCKL